MENQNEMEQLQQEQVVAQPQQRTMTMSQETKKIADEFVGLVSGLFENIEALTQVERPMNEGEWLNMSNTLMKLHQFKDRFKANIIVVEQVQRHQRGRVMTRTPQTRQEKLQDPSKQACPKCLRIMTKRHYKEKHSRTGICKAIEVVSHATAKSGGENKSEVNRVKISRKQTIVLDIIESYKHNINPDGTGEERVIINKYKITTSIFDNVLSIGEGNKVFGNGSKFYPETPDVSGSCEYRKIAEGKWVAVEKPQITKIKLKVVKKPKKVKPVLVEDEVAEHAKTTRC
jgi:hypothetical protein